MTESILDMVIHATTSNQSQAAGITTQLLDDGIDATYWEVNELKDAGYPIRSTHTYAVLKEARS